VILYALLCGTLPFDDESIPNLFKKIKSGMYSLPSHLSQSSRDLILRMLVVDPMKRATIGEIRQHPWFQHKLPAYLALPPQQIEGQERYVDEEIVQKVCELPLHGIVPDIIRDVVINASSDDLSMIGRPSAALSHRVRHDLRVAYELLLDAKRHKQRIADVVLALQDASRTPPAGSTPRLSGLGTSPGNDPSHGLGNRAAPGGGGTDRDLPARRRR
jgi:5'-AMP-activated protein kinase, catalytic alpha subunit